MGIIDDTTHTLRCSCGATESMKIIQHGSAYGGTWQSGRPFARFTVTWAPGDFAGPVISSAKCNACGAAPDISIS
jgi:hypothetical protein